MKTAISLPDDIYERATQRANELGLSRSEFFARAADRYIDELDSDSLTRAINEALSAEPDDGDSNADAVEASHRFLLADADDW